MTHEQKFYELIRHFDAGMLVTRAQDGALRARPMAIAEVEKNSDIWFMTAMDSGKIREIEAEPNVNVTFAKGSQFVSLSGVARVTADREKIDELWNPAYKVWFPDGKDDPNIVLIHIESTEAEFWDNAGTNKLSFIFRAIKALATGTTPEKDGGQHERAQLRH